MPMPGTSRKRSNKVFYGWWIVFAAFSIQVLNGGLLFNSFGIYFVALREEFQWSKTVLSGAFSLARAESGLLGPLQGWLVDKFGPRIVIQVGIVIFGLGFILLSYIDSLVTFYLAFIVLSLGSSLAGFMTAMTAVANWFAKKRTTALGIAMTGMGVGGLLVPGLAWSMNAYGWRTTAFASGVAILVLGLPSAQLFRRRPEDYGLLPDGASPASIRLETQNVDAHPAATADGFTARDAIRTSAFWLISFGHASALLVVGAMMVHLVPHAVETVGLSLQEAGIVVAVLTSMDITGRLLGGVLGDRIDKRFGVVVCMLGHVIGLLVLAYASNLAMVLVFCVVHGLAWGSRGPMLMSWRADYFGRVSYGTIMGFSSLIVMIGMIIGPIFAGVMADHFGGYREGFIVLAGMAGLGSVFFLLARRPVQPSGDRTTQRRVSPQRGVADVDSDSTS